MPDDFCLIHGYEFMQRGRHQGAIPACTKCETLPVQESGLDRAEHGGGGADPIQRLAAAPAPTPSP
jgi:hypothetical protein